MEAAKATLKGCDNSKHEQNWKARATESGSEYPQSGQGKQQPAAAMWLRLLESAGWGMNVVSAAHRQYIVDAVLTSLSFLKDICPALVL